MLKAKFYIASGSGLPSSVEGEVNYDNRTDLRSHLQNQSWIKIVLVSKKIWDLRCDDIRGIEYEAES